jgi:hypothetical protein
VFHCTTGKDRTGWAAAALLTLLGVPKETVMADYMRTNDYTLPQFKHAIDDFVAAGGDRAIAVAVFGVKPEYLDASFDEMQKQYGTIEGYFSEALGIDAAGDMLNVLLLQEKALASQSQVIQLRNARLANRINLHLALGGSFDAAPAASQ